MEKIIVYLVYNVVPLVAMSACLVVVIIGAVLIYMVLAQLLGILT